MNFLRTNVHIIKGEGEILNGQTFLKYPENFKLLQYFYASEPNKSFEESLFANIFKPLLKNITEGITSKKNNKKLGN